MTVGELLQAIFEIPNISLDAPVYIVWTDGEQPLTNASWTFCNDRDGKHVEFVLE